MPTYVYIRGVPYERGVDAIPEVNAVRPQRGVGALWGDRNYDGLRATDGVPIDSRSKHRAYMAARGLTTAEDFKGQWERQGKERADVYTTGGDHKARREAVARAAHDVYEASKRSR